MANNGNGVAFRFPRVWLIPGEQEVTTWEPSLPPLWIVPPTMDDIPRDHPNTATTTAAGSGLHQSASPMPVQGPDGGWATPAAAVSPLVPARGPLPPSSQPSSALGVPQNRREGRKHDDGRHRRRASAMNGAEALLSRQRFDALLSCVDSCLGTCLRHGHRERLRGASASTANNRSATVVGGGALAWPIPSWARIVCRVVITNYGTHFIALDDDHPDFRRGEWESYHSTFVGGASYRGGRAAADGVASGSESDCDENSSDDASKSDELDSSTSSDSDKRAVVVGINVDDPISRQDTQTPRQASDPRQNMATKSKTAAEATTVPQHEHPVVDIIDIPIIDIVIPHMALASCSKNVTTSPHGGTKYYCDIATRMPLAVRIASHSDRKIADLAKDITERIPTRIFDVFAFSMFRHVSALHHYRTQQQQLQQQQQQQQTGELVTQTSSSSKRTWSIMSVVQSPSSQVSSAPTATPPLVDACWGMHDTWADFLRCVAHTAALTTVAAGRTAAAAEDGTATPPAVATPQRSASLRGGIVAPAPAAVAVPSSADRLDEWYRLAPLADRLLFATYPFDAVVPARVEDEQLSNVAKYRQNGRVPILSWIHPLSGASLFRCSQPRVGKLGRDPFDEVLCGQLAATYDQTGTHAALRAQSRAAWMSTVVQPSSVNATSVTSPQSGPRGPSGMAASGGRSAVFTAPPTLWQDDSDNGSFASPTTATSTSIAAANPAAAAAALANHRPSLHGSARQATGGVGSATSPPPQTTVTRRATAPAAPRKLHIYDCRSRAAATANFVNGGGHEEPSNYPHSTLTFLSLDNIHGVRAAYEKLVHVTRGADKPCTDVESVSTVGGWLQGATSSSGGSHVAWLAKVESSGWLTLLQRLTWAAQKLAAALSTHGDGSAVDGGGGGGGGAESPAVGGDSERGGAAAFHYSSSSTSSPVRTTIPFTGDAFLIHCTDGWDRTSQLTSLAMLLSDPYYRTIEGFCHLVEREWLQLGHRFSDRLGIALAYPAATSTGALASASSNVTSAATPTGYVDPMLTMVGTVISSFASESTAAFLAETAVDAATGIDGGALEADNEGNQGNRITSQASPVFLQFLDAVRIIRLQFPTAFEFTEEFLVFLAEVPYSGAFGSFLFNSHRARLRRGGLASATLSVWSYVRWRLQVEHRRTARNNNNNNSPTSRRGGPTTTASATGAGGGIEKPRLDEDGQQQNRATQPSLDTAAMGSVAAAVAWFPDYTASARAKRVFAGGRRDGGGGDAASPQTYSLRPPAMRFEGLAELHRATFEEAIIALGDKAAAVARGGNGNRSGSFDDGTNESLFVVQVDTYAHGRRLPAWVNATYAEHSTDALFDLSPSSCVTTASMQHRSAERRDTATMLPFVASRALLPVSFHSKEFNLWAAVFTPMAHIFDATERYARRVNVQNAGHLLHGLSDAAFFHQRTTAVVRRRWRHVNSKLFQEAAFPTHGLLLQSAAAGDDDPSLLGGGGDATSLLGATGKTTAAGASDAGWENIDLTIMAISRSAAGATVSAHNSHQRGNANVAVSRSAALEAPQPTAVLFVPAEDAESCYACGVAFTLLRRRHTCRLCCRSVCGTCGARSIYVDPRLIRLESDRDAVGPVRVCNTCYVASVVQGTQR